MDFREPKGCLQTLFSGTVNEIGETHPMTRRWILAALTTLPLAAAPALAARKRVALLPASVTEGADSNAGVITEALRQRLSKIGFEVISADRTSSGMRNQKMDLNEPQSVKDLSELRAELGVDFVVYPRVLSVGKSLTGGDYQANVLVNVAGKSASGFAHTRQVGQVFKPRSAKASTPVIGKADADTAATKLLTGFESRAK